MSNEIENIEAFERELDTVGVFASNTVGVSMKPLFKTHRNMVVIEKPKGELKKYDVVLYKNRLSKYVLHRIIKVENERYVIRGDNTFVKEYLPKSEILGVLVAYRDKNKRHTVNDLSYKIYSRLWNFIYPVRHAVHSCRVMLGKIYRKMFGKGRK